jgi:hypothetical protein
MSSSRLLDLVPVKIYAMIGFTVAKTAKALLQHTTLGDELGKAIRKAAGQ